MPTNPGYPESVRNLITQFGKLPGVGARSAERMAFHTLKQSPAQALELADAIREVKNLIKNCSVCFNLTETDPCPICTDTSRDHTTICVVEQPKDLLQIEATGAYHGVYHVLQGHIAPLDNQQPHELTIAALLARVRTQPDTIHEIILATNPTMDGDGTALYIQEQLASLGSAVKVTRLARGLPAGGQIEYTSKAILTDALTGRTSTQ